MTEAEVTASNIYAFLSKAAHYPLEDHINKDFLEFFVLLKDELSGIDTSKEPSELLSQFEQDPDSFLSQLQIEYTRLFINSPSGVVAPPYGSVYLHDGDRSLWGNTTAAVKAFYRRYGLDIADAQVVPDELSLELEFLSYLAAKGQTDAEREFLEKFFRPWFCHFKEKVYAEAQHPFYKYLVELIDIFTNEEDSDYGTKD